MEAGVRIALFGLLGWCAGAMHFALLRRNVDLIASGPSAISAAAATLGRFALTAGIFVLAGIFCGIGVLWMLVGFVAARSAAVRVARAQV